MFFNLDLTFYLQAAFSIADKVNENNAEQAEGKGWGDGHREKQRSPAGRDFLQLGAVFRRVVYTGTNPEAGSQGYASREIQMRDARIDFS